MYNMTERGDEGPARELGLFSQTWPNYKQTQKIHKTPW